jgi:hypothetical protein
MERAEAGTVLFEKIGGGSFVLKVPGQRDKMVKQGQRFRVKPEFIPAAFRDLCQPVNPAELNTVVNEPNPDVTKVEYELQETEEEGLFDVLDSEGKAVNENPLPKKEAEELKSSLE